MIQRKSDIKRHSSETQIELVLNLDGQGRYDIDTPIPFFSHMLEAFAKHGSFDISLKADGDVEVDDHHLVEDVGICLGMAFQEALGDYKGIQRYGHFSLVMEETWVEVALDLSKRYYFVYDVDYESAYIKGFELQLLEEALRSFSIHLGLNVHFYKKCGRNSHHIHEAIFKCLARALKMAVLRTGQEGSVPSTKGMLG